MRARLTKLVCLIVAAGLVAGLAAAQLGLLRGAGAGYYAIRPSVAAGLALSLEEFGKIAGSLQGLAASCDEPGCLEAELSKPGYEGWLLKWSGMIMPRTRAREWLEGCESPEQNLFYDFVELYQSCAASPERDCLCELKLEEYEKLDKVIDIKKELSPLGELSATASLEGLREFLYDPEARILKDGKIAPEQYRVRLDSDRIVLYRSPEGKLAYVVGRAPSKLSCELENRMLRACITLNTTLRGRDSEGKSIIAQKPKLRFAFELADLPPPPIVPLAAYDLAKAEGAIVLSWLASPAADVVGYNIYWSERQLEGKSTAELKGIVNSVSLRSVDALLLPSSIDFSQLVDCVPVAGLCSYAYRDIAGLEHKLKPGTLYFDGVIYTYVLAVPEAVELNFGVSALDRADQETILIERTVSGRSVDDLAPGKLSCRASPVDGRLSLAWSAPTQNIDGSTLEDFTEIAYTVYRSCDGMPFEPVVSKTALTTAIVERPECSYSVIALDLNPEEIPQPGSAEFTLALEQNICSSS